MHSSLSLPLHSLSLFIYIYIYLTSEVRVSSKRSSFIHSVSQSVSMCDYYIKMRCLIMAVIKAFKGCLLQLRCRWVKNDFKIFVRVFVNNYRRHSTADNPILAVIEKSFVIGESLGKGGIIFAKLLTVILRHHGIWYNDIQHDDI